MIIFFLHTLFIGVGVKAVTDLTFKKKFFLIIKEYILKFFSSYFLDFKQNIKIIFSVFLFIWTANKPWEFTLAQFFIFYLSIIRDIYIDIYHFPLQLIGCGEFFA